MHPRSIQERTRYGQQLQSLQQELSTAQEVLQATQQRHAEGEEALRAWFTAEKGSLVQERDGLSAELANMRAAHEDALSETERLSAELVEFRAAHEGALTQTERLYEELARSKVAHEDALAETERLSAELELSRAAHEDTTQQHLAFHEASLQHEQELARAVSELQEELAAVQVGFFAKCAHFRVFVSYVCV